MPQFNRRELDVRAREYGFNRDTFEKVLRLRTILDSMKVDDIVIVKGYDGEKSVKVVAVSGKYESELGLQIEKYRKTIRKA